MYEDNSDKLDDSLPSLRKPLPKHQQIDTLFQGIDLEKINQLGQQIKDETVQKIPQDLSVNRSI